MANITPHIAGRDQRIFIIGVDFPARTYSPGDTAIACHLFTHVVALAGSSSFSHSFTVKTILSGFAIEQDGIVFARIVLLETPTRLIMPDNFVFEARPLIT